MAICTGQRDTVGLRPSRVYVIRGLCLIIAIGKRGRTVRSIFTYPDNKYLGCSCVGGFVAADSSRYTRAVLRGSSLLGCSILLPMHTSLIDGNGDLGVGSRAG